LRDPIYKKKADGNIVLSLQYVCAGYGNRFRLRNITFSLQRGCFLGILGPNGSGKTTLLNTLCGVVPLQSGKIELFGKPLQTYSGKKRAALMAVLAQDTAIHFPFRCSDVVWMGRFPHRKRFQPPGEDDIRAVNWAMKVTETETLAERLITEVSGGERQRVMLARVLAQKTPILLLDEPTSAMDVRWTLRTFGLLKELCQKDGATVIAIMHDINMAALFCDLLLFLKNGEMLGMGAVQDVLSVDVLEEVYGTKAFVYQPDGLGRPQVIFPPEPDPYYFGAGSESSENT